jgi:hypothetical protein
MVRINARTGSAENEIKGPTVFKRTKDVEYTLFLPYDVIASENGCRDAARFLLKGIQEILTRAHVAAEGFEARKASIEEHICSDPAMLKTPWSVAFPKGLRLV